MILFEGKLFPDEELDDVLDRLWDSCLNTIKNREEIWEKVVNACESISLKLKNGVYDSVLKQLLSKGAFTQTQLDEVVKLFDRKNLLLKYQTELGNYKAEIEKDKNTGRIKQIVPLGILFHIAAGNAEGLPFFSVLEGLLAGNVNILKLPSMDDGISILLLHEMVKEEPSLAPYVCVLDVPSTNLDIMKKLADIADGIVVWGGDAAIRAVRSYAAPNTQIINWGHKLSFAYVTQDVLEDIKLQQELYVLAHHMCETRQVLCSSCQGIYVDTDDEKMVHAIGKKYFEILQETASEFEPESIGVRGKLGIALYNEELENRAGKKQILKGNGVSVIVDYDSNLELSHMFRNCWVKPLLRESIVHCLKEKKGYLQTVGLICEETKRKELAAEFIKAGVTRITHGGNMSVAVPGEAHDGEYPLRRYCRIVEIE